MALFRKGLLIQARFWHLGPQAANHSQPSRWSCQGYFTAAPLPIGYVSSRRARLFQAGPTGSKLKQKDNLQHCTQLSCALALCPVQNFTHWADTEAIDRFFPVNMWCVVTTVDEGHKEWEWEPETWQVERLALAIWTVTKLHGASVMPVRMTSKSLLLCC